ncbi:MAG TPA: DUF192 domain-containing protein [Actinomycetota bacterium]|nr:DUF192 domain-containing protein [Actinomycetota bacterium]
MVRRLFPFILLAGLMACSSADFPTHAGPPVVTFEGGEPASLRMPVQIADSSEERAKGLMDVAELPDRTGMAFVWDEPTTDEFWMKDTLIPLSIAFVDENDQIVTIRDMEPCTAEPCPKYGAAAPYVLAIETNAGFFDRHEIQVGDRAELGTGPAS